MGIYKIFLTYEFCDWMWTYLSFFYKHLLSNDYLDDQVPPCLLLYDIFGSENTQSERDNKNDVFTQANDILPRFTIDLFPLKELRK